MKPLLFSLLVFLLGSLNPCFGGMYDETPLESGLLYRVRLDGKLPCEYLQITLTDAPTEYRPNKKRLTKILLLDSDKKTVLQRFDSEDLDFDGASAEEGDFNFDGYRDFRSILWEQCGTGGRSFAHFVFNPQKRRYERCPQLDVLSSPYPDYQKKLIASYSRGGGMYSTHREYRWINGKLVVLSEVWRSGDDKGWFTEYSTYADGTKKKSKRIYLSEE